MKQNVFETCCLIGHFKFCRSVIVVIESWFLNQLSV